MALFQKAVLNKYLKNLDEVNLKASYELYTKEYCNETKIDNIKASKEEQYQEGFLDDIFVKVLGYTKFPQPDHNLITEQKNETDSKKADGAILKNDSIIAVIELKSTSTTDFKKIEEQAYNYKGQHKGCKYIITSNFAKLRLYINDVTDFEEFDLFEMSFDRFKIFYLCLNKENIISDTTAKIKEESFLQEENVSTKLYKDYSSFKRKIFDNLVKNNPQVDKILLLKKSQKLLDRLLFIFFAEDRGLIPANTISEILKEFNDLKERDRYEPLYKTFKVYFRHLNEGSVKLDIPEYNGGLFAPDEILDTVIIDDSVLIDDTLKLSKYDFETEVDANILGHIFENSLSDIEELHADLEGVELDKNKTKRKKDGVFYTPKYITKYIVENTVGQLCREKKNELGIDELDIPEDTLTGSGKNRKVKDKYQNFINNLDEYQNYLLTLKILDPACGSGAFLIQALDFLMAEHRYIGESKNKITHSTLPFSDIDISILENNLYGVDINEESVEIAKLSLWLQTAVPGRRLSDLSNNIKCGNSLIDDPAVAGEKAFDWNKEFSEIMSKGGFDVVIGNPPYVNLEKLKSFSNGFSNFQTYSKKGDIYTLFVEKGFNLLNLTGFISFIMSNKWLQAGYGEKLRQYFLQKEIRKLIDFGDLQIFEGATTYPCIFIASNSKPLDQLNVSVLPSANNIDFNNIVKSSEEIFNFSKFSNEAWVISSVKDKELLTRLKNTYLSLEQFVKGEANYGIKFGLTEAFLIDKVKRDELINKDPSSKEIIGLLARGRDITRYGIPNLDNLDYIILAGFGVGYSWAGTVLKIS